MNPDRQHHAELLKQWVAAHHELESVFEKIEAVFGNSPDTPLWNAAWAMFDRYTESLAEIVGDENGDWLPWFFCECDMGRKPREMIFTDGERLMVVGIDDLLAAIQTHADGTRKLS